MKKIFLMMSVILCMTVACANNEKQVVVCEENYQGNYFSEADKAHYRENIVEKRRGERYVSYEYQNVRIDEIAALAAYYCEQKSKKAYLREIVMRENHSRLATFDCVDLQ